jgi:hypothetical protein
MTFVDIALWILPVVVAVGAAALVAWALYSLWLKPDK